MDKIEISKRLNNAKKTMFNPNSTEKQLMGALKSVFTVSKYLNKEDLRANEIMAKLYYLLGEYELSRNIYSYMLDIKEGNPKYYLGIYKTYVGQGDINNIKSSLDNYKISIMEDLNNCNFELIDYLINFNLNNSKISVNNKEKYLFFDVSIDEELNEKYNKLIDLVNNYKFDKSLKLAKEMNFIAQIKKYRVEFFTLYKLLELTNLNYINKININRKNKYSNLKKHIKEKNCEGILEQLKHVENDSFKDNLIITKGMYVLIENNYLEAVMDLLNDVNFGKLNKQELKLLNIAIKEKELINNLNEQELYTYETAINEGRKAYKNDDLNTAFDIYLWGLFSTNAPIFYYYCGKILYKSKKFEEAKKYFLHYIDSGVTKSDKAYLYLSKIYEKTNNSKLSIYYCEMVSKINSLFDKEYEYYCNDLTDNSEYDKLKMNVQRNTIIDESYFLEHKLKDVKKYIELIESTLPKPIHYL